MFFNVFSKKDYVATKMCFAVITILNCMSVHWIMFDKIQGLFLSKFQQSLLKDGG